jgi:hypothetical protein
VEEQIKGQVIETRRSQRDESEAQEHEVDSHGIPQGLEMRGGIARLIDGANRLLDDLQRELACRDQHFQFELITRSRDAKQAFGQFPGNCSQAGLSV